MLTVLGGLAEFERELIMARTDEGRKRAQVNGVQFGRKLKLTKHQRKEAMTRRQAGETLVEIGKSYNVSHSTISRLAEPTPTIAAMNSSTTLADYSRCCLVPSHVRQCGHRRGFG